MCLRIDCFSSHRSCDFSGFPHLQIRELKAQGGSSPALVKLLRSITDSHREPGQVQPVQARPTVRLPPTPSWRCLIGVAFSKGPASWAQAGGKTRACQSAHVSLAPEAAGTTVSGPLAPTPRGIPPPEGHSRADFCGHREYVLRHTHADSANNAGK